MGIQGKGEDEREMTGMEGEEDFGKGRECNVQGRVRG